MQSTPRLPCLLAALAAAASPLAAQRVLQTCLGLQQAEHFGTTIVTVGDVDGDGTPDLAIGAPDSDYGTAHPDRGTVRIVSGRTTAGFSVVARGPSRASPTRLR